MTAVSKIGTPFFVCVLHEICAVHACNAVHLFSHSFALRQHDSAQPYCKDIDARLYNGLNAVQHTGVCRMWCLV